MLKETTYRSVRMRQSARDRACVNCGLQDGSVVFCHLNDGEFGRGIGMKGSDLMGFWGCRVCHDLYDGRAGGLGKEAKRAMGWHCCCRTLYRFGQEGFFEWSWLGKARLGSVGYGKARCQTVVRPTRTNVCRT